MHFTVLLTGYPLPLSKHTTMNLLKQTNVEINHKQPVGFKIPAQLNDYINILRIVKVEQYYSVSLFNANTH